MTTETMREAVALEARGLSPLTDEEWCVYWAPWQSMLDAAAREVG